MAVVFELNEVPKVLPPDDLPPELPDDDVEESESEASGSPEVQTEKSQGIFHSQYVVVEFSSSTSLSPDLSTQLSMLSSQW